MPSRTKYFVDGVALFAPVGQEVDDVVGHQREPVLVVPLLEQPRFVVEELLDFDRLGAVDGRHHTAAG
jgi:hypothetical protein